MLILNVIEKLIQMVSMGGQAEGQACLEPGARTPMRQGNYYILSILLSLVYSETVFKLPPKVS